MAPALSSEALKAFYQAYKTTFSASSSASEGIHRHQLSAMLFRLKSGVPPFADFSVFGPYGSRVNRRLEMKAHSGCLRTTWDPRLGEKL